MLSRKVHLIEIVACFYRSERESLFDRKQGSKEKQLDEYSSSCLFGGPDEIRTRDLQILRNSMDCEKLIVT
jgi:hypothetical protein